MKYIDTIEDLELLINSLQDALYFEEPDQFDENGTALNGIGQDFVTVIEIVDTFKHNTDEIAMILEGFENECIENNTENKYITWLSNNVNEITNIYFEHKLHHAETFLNSQDFFEFKNKQKIEYQDFVKNSVNERLFNIDKNILELDEYCVNLLKSVAVEEYAWIETYIKNCMLDIDKDLYLELRSEILVCKDDEKIKELTDNFITHIKSQINNNVRTLGLKNSHDKPYFPFTEQNGSLKYSTTNSSGNPDVILRKTNNKKDWDGGIAFTYANHFVDTNMEGDQAERHSAILIEAETLFQNQKKAKFGTILHKVQKKYDNNDKQRKLYSNQIKNKNVYTETVKNFTLSSYQNLDTTCRKIKQMVTSYFENFYPWFLKENLKDVEKIYTDLIAMHQGLMIMAQDTNNNYDIENYPKINDSVLHKEMSSFYDGVSMSNRKTREEVNEYIKNKFLIPKIDENSLLLLDFDIKDMASYTLDNEIVLNSLGNLSTKSKSKNAVVLKKDIFTNDNFKHDFGENFLIQLYLINLLNNVNENQKIGVFEVIVSDLKSRVFDSEEFQSRDKSNYRNDLTLQAERLTGIFGDKVKTILELLDVKEKLEDSTEELSDTKELDKVIIYLNNYEISLKDFGINQSFENGTTISFDGLSKFVDYIIKNENETFLNTHFKSLYDKVKKFKSNTNVIDNNNLQNKNENLKPK